MNHSTRGSIGSPTRRSEKMRACPRYMHVRFEEFTPIKKPTVDGKDRRFRGSFWLRIKLLIAMLGDDVLLYELTSTREHNAYMFHKIIRKERGGESSARKTIRKERQRTRCL